MAVAPSATPCAWLPAEQAITPFAFSSSVSCETVSYTHLLELRDEHGYTFVHPFDDENVIAGQGTIGLEILDQFQM